MNASPARCTWAHGSDEPWGVQQSGQQFCMHAFVTESICCSPVRWRRWSIPAVPVLLIHGEDDRNIAPRHSQLIAAAAPDHVELWLVPHAGHTMAWAAAHREFETRLLGWFASHTYPQHNIRQFHSPLLSDFSKIIQFFGCFCTVDLCKLGSIYEFGKDYRLLIFLLLWIVSCVPVFFQPGC